MVDSPELIACLPNSSWTATLTKQLKMRPHQNEPGFGTHQRRSNQFARANNRCGQDKARSKEPPAPAQSDLGGSLIDNSLRA